MTKLNENIFKYYILIFIKKILKIMKKECFKIFKNRSPF